MFDMKTQAEVAADRKRSSRKSPRARLRRRVVWCPLIREERQRLGLSIRDVAAGSRVNHSTVYGAELGHEVSLTHARMIARFFGKTVEQLWPPPLPSRRRQPGGSPRDD